MRHGEFIPKDELDSPAVKKGKEFERPLAHHQKQIEAKREEMTRERSARRQKKGKSDE